MTYIHSTASNAGDAIQAIREVAAESLPRGYGFEFAGISREESQTTNNTGVIFLICTVFVYLILCGLYESFFVPFAVILAVPFGLMGSFLFAKLMGLENNIYMQTGLIMLIGLLAKTASCSPSMQPTAGVRACRLCRRPLPRPASASVPS